MEAAVANFMLVNAVGVICSGFWESIQAEAVGKVVAPNRNGVEKLKDGNFFN